MTALVEAVRARASGAWSEARELCDGLAHPSLDARLVDSAVASCLDGAIRALWERGWQPRDLAEVAKRKLEPLARSFLLDVVVAEADKYAAHTVDPRWRAQLDELNASIWWQPNQPHLTQWTARHRVDRPAALYEVLTVLAFCGTAPALSRFLPLPGSASVRPETREHREVDEKVLARIRALLAKAESTEFPEEAEALSSKAQELMTKFSLDRALLDAEDGNSAKLASGATGRRIWLEAPYVTPKSLLVHAVARANRCRSVADDKTGYVAVIGNEVDLELVEILTTSLLLQASRAMLAHGSQISRFGHSSTRSWRQSFLVSYANRIGERLAEASESTQASVGEETSARLLPVLAAREQQVDNLFTELFPRTVSRSVSVSNSAGWAAGRAAADLATLDAREALTG